MPPRGQGDHAHASRVTLSLAWSGLLALVIRLLFGKLSRRYLDMEWLGLKRRCEASSAPAPPPSPAPTAEDAGAED